LSIPNEGYSRNILCVLHLISTFFIKKYFISCVYCALKIDHDDPVVPYITHKK